MGAPTNSRKRDYYFSSNSNSTPFSPDLDYRSNLHLSKKPRISSLGLSPDRPISHVSPHSTVYRIHRYPEPTQRFRREVHAPCRKSKFSVSLNSGRETLSQASLEEMWNSLRRRYNQVKSTLKHSRKEKAVIEVEAECSKDVISEDLSVEEVQVLDDGREGEVWSMVSDQRSRDTSGDAFLLEKYEMFADYSSAVSDLTNQTLKVDGVGKMIESLSVNRGVESGMLPHKKLHNLAERRNTTLDGLAFEISLAEKKRSSFLSKPTKKPEEDVLREPFAPLTDEEEIEVSHAFSNSTRRKILVTHENSNIEITGEILQCLRPGAWLNDEVINVYLELLKEREKREPKKFLKCHFFNTFFYKKLISGRNGYDFKAVRRWTTQRKIGYGLIECDKIFVPIHKEIHWCLAVINKKDEKFQYLDSLKGMDTKVLKVLAKYYADEVKDKSGKDINVSSWRQEYVHDLPEQENGWDCGMFMIKYADFYSRSLGLCFGQDHMPYFRKRTAKEILRLKAE